MKTKKITLIAIILAGAFTLSAQNGYEDDVYFSSRRNRKIENEQKIVRKTEQDRMKREKQSAARIRQQQMELRDTQREQQREQNLNSKRAGSRLNSDYYNQADPTNSIDIDTYNRRKPAREVYNNNESSEYRNGNDRDQRRSDIKRKRTRAGKYSDRIARYHAPQTLTVRGTGNVNINFDDGYYGYDYDTYYDGDESYIDINVNFDNYYGYDPWYRSSYNRWNYPYGGYWPRYGFYSSWCDPWYNSSWYFNYPYYHNPWYCGYGYGYGYYDNYYYPYAYSYYTTPYTYYSNARKTNPRYEGYSSRYDERGQNRYNNDSEYDRSNNGYSSRNDDVYSRRNSNPYLDTNRDRGSAYINRGLGNRNNSALDRVNSSRTRTETRSERSHSDVNRSEIRNNNPYLQNRNNTNNSGSSSRNNGSYSPPVRNENNSGSSGSSSGGRVSGRRR